jgi:hypothetical protein
MDPRKIAVAGVVVAAVLASLLIQPAIGRLATWGTTWLAAAIFLIPTVAVLAITGYRLYGPGRSVAVAVAIMAITGVVTWLMSIVTVASALAGSNTSLGLVVALFAVPAVLVLVLGLVAVKFVPERPAGGRRLSTRVAGRPAT